MLKQQARLFRRLSLIIDLAVIAVAFILAYAIRQNYLANLAPLQTYLWALAIAAPVWYVLMRKEGLYESLRSLSCTDILSRLIYVHAMGGLLVAAVIFFTVRDKYSRGLYLLFVFCSLLLFLVTKIAMRGLLGYLRRKGYNVRHIIIVGTQDKAQRLHELIAGHAEWGVVIQGVVQSGPPPLQEQVLGHKVLGHIDRLVDICKDHLPDEVIFCLPRELSLQADNYIHNMEEMGITVRVILDVYASSIATRRELGMFHNELPILTVHTKCFDAQQLMIKRLLDVVGALVGLSLFSFLFPWLALAIRLDTKGPVFFSQERVGENGRIFRCWKLRTMVMDAEKKKAELQQYNQMNGAMFKIQDDPRVTRVGKWLRKTSLDEFPQFWNVLKGEMSLVGTRPPTKDEVLTYQNWHRKRICIKPGITGLWQVSGRSLIDDFDEVVRLDLQYIDNWTLWLDIKLLLKTIRVVLTRHGAC